MYQWSQACIDPSQRLLGEGGTAMQSSQLGHTSSFDKLAFVDTPACVIEVDFFDLCSEVQNCLAPHDDVVSLCHLILDLLEEQHNLSS